VFVRLPGQKKAKEKDRVIVVSSTSTRDIHPPCNLSAIRSDPRSARFSSSLTSIPSSDIPQMTKREFLLSIQGLRKSVKICECMYGEAMEAYGGYLPNDQQINT
jgi:hypothetical protein